MFGLDLGELIILVLAALVLLRPKDVPKVARKVGRIVGQLKEYWASLSRDFTAELESLEREAEQERLQKEAGPPGGNGKRRDGAAKGPQEPGREEEERP